MSITVRERLREFGLLKAMGIPSRDIVLSVLAEVVIIALLAGIGGVAIGFYGANVVKQLLINMGVNFDVTITFRYTYAVTGFATSLGVAVIGALSPIRKIAQLRPLEIVQSWR
ncbi:ABC transporter permease [Pyrobaculum aerophilum]|nr:ABC transporter permease [Pyrobaculum aerophilum]